MEKLPTKQIYLLAIIIVGLVTLSVYSTYAIFSFESSTSDVVSLKTPNSLYLNTDIAEYRQVSVPKDDSITADVDIYNTYNYDVCYSIWYKVIAEKSTVNAYEKTDKSIATSGLISAGASKRVTVLLTNDDEEDALVNIGLSYVESGETCNLNLTEDKMNITKTIANGNLLNNTIIKSVGANNNSEGYLKYENNNKVIDLPNDKKVNISDKFTLSNEAFTLTDPIEIENKDIANYESNDNKKYYTCLTDKTCSNLIEIIKTTKEEKTETVDGNPKVVNYYHISKYNTLVGYLEGSSGIRKVGNDYYYFGDNPNNFVYYNCTNDSDKNTCELWRIVGLIHDDKDNTYLTKLVRDEGIGTYAYGETQEWNDTSLNTYLKKDYKLNNTSFLKEVTMKQENLANLTSDITYLDDEIKTKVNIINLTDFINTSTCTNKLINEFDTNCIKNNWLHKNSSSFWTMTVKYETTTTDSEEVTTPENNSVYSISNNIDTTKIDTKLSVRPVVYLSGRVLIGNGNGSLANPYEIR